jgi:hypothetical protein
MMHDKEPLMDGHKAPLVAAVASLYKVKRKWWILAAVGAVLVLGLFRIAILHFTRPSFLGSWQNISSMGLPNGTYDNSVKKYTFNADGTGTEESGSLIGQEGEYPELTTSPFTWMSGKDPNLGMNNAPIMAIHFDAAPADAPPFTYHWSVSDDQETLEMDDRPFTKVVQ